METDGKASRRSSYIPGRKDQRTHYERGATYQINAPSASVLFLFLGSIHNGYMEMDGGGHVNTRRSARSAGRRATHVAAMKWRATRRRRSSHFPRQPLFKHGKVEIRAPFDPFIPSQGDVTKMRRLL